MNKRIKIKQILEFNKPTLLNYNDAFSFRDTNENIIFLKIQGNKRIDIYCMFLESKYPDLRSNVYKFYLHRNYHTTVRLISKKLQNELKITYFDPFIMEYML